MSTPDADGEADAGDLIVAAGIDKRGHRGPALVSAEHLAAIVDAFEGVEARVTALEKALAELKAEAEAGAALFRQLFPEGLPPSA